MTVPLALADGDGLADLQRTRTPAAQPVQLAKLVHRRGELGGDGPERVARLDRIEGSLGALCGGRGIRRGGAQLRASPGTPILELRTGEQSARRARHRDHQHPPRPDLPVAADTVGAHDGRFGYAVAAGDLP